MAKFDRYVLSQLLLYFGFFALVLVAVFWISRAVRLFDRLIADGQSVIVFLEFTALGLPRIVLMVLPLACFAAAVFVTNRLSNESELTVMQATGSGPWRLARPVFAFSLFVALMVAALAHVLVPTALDQLTLRENEVNKDVTARLLTEGAFLHPSEGVTLYTRAIDEDGVLQDVFLSDRREPDARVTYTAANAYLVRGDGTASILMVDGLVQRFTPEDRRLVTGVFQDFSYDISNIVDESASQERGVRSMTTAELMEDWTRLSTRTGLPIGLLAEEFHSRIAQPIFAMSTALFGFGVLLAGGFSRFGAWKEVLAAFSILLVLDSLRAALSDTVRDLPEFWPLAYLPAAIGIALSLALLSYAARPIRLRARAAA